MNFEKARRKMLAQQNLSNIVLANRKQESYQRDMLAIEANSVSSKTRAERKRAKALAGEEEILAKQEKERQIREENERQQRLADELFELQRKKTVEEKLRQQIRESNHDLKELETRLRAAYVAKGLAAQRQEREALLLQERLRMQDEQRELERIRMSDEEFARMQHEQEEKKKREWREALKEQIVTAHIKKQHLYKEFLMEKRFLDEIAKRLQDENIEEMRQKLLKMERTKKDMKEWREAKEARKREQQIEMEEENQRILAYCEARDRKKAEEEALKKQAEKEREQTNEKMVAELSEKISEAQKREQLLQELHEIEKDERETERFREELEAKLRMRIESRIALDIQRANNQLKKDMEAEEARRFETEQMEFLAERDKLEQLSDEKRRRKRLEHKQAVRELMETRRIERAEMRAALVREYESDVAESERREKLIEEERLALLKEHATALLGFLPNGILKELSNA